MKFTIATLLFAVLAFASAAQSAEAPAETPAQRDQRMGWFREARFGMFIHWGVYSVPAGTYNGQRIGGLGEWIMHDGKIPMLEYQKFAKQFNPVKFNADQWVAIAKDAGMKYIVITSKHHDGFAMYDTKACDWSIVKATPFGRDPLKELAEACRKQGLKLGFYYSQAQDWNNGGATSGGRWDPAQEHSMDDYIDKIAVPQVREILTNYGEFPAILWWDTPMNMNQARAQKLYAVAKELRPNIILNDRLGGNFPGDTNTPEQTIPAQGFPNRDWETCMTMNNTWGFKSFDNNWKTTQTLVRNLIDCSSKGGNFLLNVGPTSEGLIPDPSVQRLAEVGKWMKTNNEAIYGSTASAFKKLSWGKCTQKPGKLYLHVFDWPTNGTLVVPMTTKITKAYLLADKSQTLATTATESGIEIKVPAAAPDPIATVIVAEIDGPVQAIVQIAKQAPDGVIALTATDAEIHGDAGLEKKAGIDNIGSWMSARTYVDWQVQVTKPGKFNVSITYACTTNSGGSAFDLLVGDQKLSGTIAVTGNWDTFTTVNLGTITIDKPGQTTFTLKPTSKPRTAQAVMNLRNVTLKPAE
jgi:alpha-L-fucosidase